jgi:hypothetical protein
METIVFVDILAQKQGVYRYVRFNDMARTKMLKIILYMILACLCNVCFSSQLEEIDKLIPAEAYGVSKIKLEDEHMQLTFSIKITYPSFAVPKERTLDFEKTGWKLCENDLNWMRFFDENKQYIFQSFMSLLKDNTFMRIVMNYYSPTELKIPSDDIQHVYIIRYLLRNQDEVNEIMRLFCQNASK